MNDREKSDSVVVPAKRPNKAGAAARDAEVVEERTLAEGNSCGADTRRTQCRESVKSGLARVREAAQKDRKQRFTALYHHVYEVDALRMAYWALNRKAAAGVDGVTWKSYGEELEKNLQDLSVRLKRGAYRAKPVRRVHIKKSSGGQRPLGILTLEDKLVQRATTTVMNAIYEVDFLGFSYGFRPGRSQHMALDALAGGLREKGVRWVLDADIRGFFDALDHDWMVNFVKHRIGDQRIIRLLKKWLKAGVLEGEEYMKAEKGAIQGGSISPLLGNIYLHYVFDLWSHQWRKRHARGSVTIVRYADDIVVGFEHQSNARRFLVELRARFAEFALELHPDKTRLLEFGHFALTNRQRRGVGKPETFEFLGLTHICGRSRRGYSQIVRKTSPVRFRKKLKDIKDVLRRTPGWSIPSMGMYLASVVRGHVAYYGVPGNSRRLASFRYEVAKLWKGALERRSERTRVRWDRMSRLIARWLPPTRVCHPYPEVRFRARTQGRSPVR